MRRCEGLSERDDVYGHGAENRDMKDLVRAAPNVERPWSEAFWESELWQLVREITG